MRNPTVVILLLASFAVFAVNGNFKFEYKAVGAGCSHTKYEAGDGTIEVCKCTYVFKHLIERTFNFLDVLFF